MGNTVWYKTYLSNWTIKFIKQEDTMSDDYNEGGPIESGEKLDISSEEHIVDQDAIEGADGLRGIDEILCRANSVLKSVRLSEELTEQDRKHLTKNLWNIKTKAVSFEKKPEWFTAKLEKELDEMIEFIYLESIGKREKWGGIIRVGIAIKRLLVGKIGERSGGVNKETGEYNRQAYIGGIIGFVIHHKIISIIILLAIIVFFVFIKK
jgi:hypothetical protein